MERIGVVVNPLSGHGAATHLAHWLRLRLGDRHDLVEVSPTADIDGWVRQRLGGPCERILVVGGDGTFRSVAAKLVGSDLALGLIATGTNNNIARALALPVDPYEAAEIALADRTEWIAAGRINGSVFFEEASIGLEAKLFPVGEAFVRHNLSGILAGPVALATVEPAAVTVELTDSDYRDTLSAYTMSISNVAVTGAHLPIAPGRDIRDPRLWLTIYHSLGPVAALRSVVDMMRHHPVPSQYVTRHPFMHARFTACDPLCVAADGTPIGTLPVEVESIPHAVRVACPGEAASQAVVQQGGPATPVAVSEARR